MNHLIKTNLLLLLSVLLTGCAVIKNSARDEMTRNRDTRPYNWEVQTVLRFPFIAEYDPLSNLQPSPFPGFPIQFSGQADEPVVVIRQYEDYTSEQINTLKNHLLNTGRYLAVNCRQLPPNSEH